MARILGGEPRTRQSNPSILGEDVMEAVELGLGIVAAGFANDKIVHPLVGNFASGVTGTMGQLMDGATTLASAWLVGTGVGMANKRIGTRMKKGGIIYGFAKMVGAFVPGYSLSATYPAFSPFGGMMKALATATPAAALTTTERTPVGVSGL
jgi:hypothetical protein